VSKVRVAQTVVESSWGDLADGEDVDEEGRISSPDGAEVFAELHRRLLAAFGIEDSSEGE
jgi:hypothetical protein